MSRVKGKRKLTPQLLSRPRPLPTLRPQTTPAKVENKPPETIKEGKGRGKGKRGKSEPRVEKRKHQ